MSSVFPVPIIITIAAVSCLVVLGTTWVILKVVILRRQKQHPEVLIAANRRHLSHYSENHRKTVHFAHHPPRARLHRSPLRSPYSPTKLRLAQQSRDSLLGHPAFAEKTGGQHWHLQLPPPRFAASRFFATKIPVAPLSPITERSTNTAEHTPNLESQSATMAHIVPLPKNFSDDSLRNFPASDALKPAPLFHGKQRSSSSSALADLGHRVTRALPLPGPPGIGAARPKPILKRSFSLQSQHSGYAPLGPLPPLPKEPYLMQRLKNHTSISSITSTRRESLGSVSSSIMDMDRATRALTASPMRNNRTFSGIFQGRTNPVTSDRNASRHDCSRPATSIHSSGPFVKAGLLSHPVSRNSLKASIEQTTTSTPWSRDSSSLSLALADRYAPSPHDSNASRLDHGPESPVQYFGKGRGDSRLGTNKGRIDNGLNLWRNSLVIGSLPSFPDDRPRHTTETGQSLQRVSKSILQDISGNSGSPRQYQFQQENPSAGSDDPFVWDNQLQWEDQRASFPRRTSAKRPRSEGHKRQSYQRISFVPPVTPSTFTPTITEIEEAIENRDSHEDSRNKASLAILEPRPPSRATFEPQIKCLSTSPSRDSNYTSIVMSGHNSHSPDHKKPPEPAFYTPTRGPSARRQGSYRPSSVLNIAPWPILTPTSSLGVMSPKSLDAPSDNGQAFSPPNTPFSDLSFPKPPKASAPNWREVPHRAIQGPRPQSRHSHNRRSPKSRSPLRNVVRNSPHNSFKDMRTNIIQLRRMNSDVTDRGGVELKQYRNMGDTSSISESCGDKDDQCGDLDKRAGTPAKDEDLGNIGQEMMQSARRKLSLDSRNGCIDLNSLSTDWEKRTSGSILEKECF